MTGSMVNLLWMSGFILACLLFYRYAIPRLKRFDENNVERINRQAQEKHDPSAHIRHALDVASEQVEEVQEIRTGAVTHYLFEAQAYASRDEAEEMRARRVAVVARRFYEELPAALMGREKPSNLSARERAGSRWKRTVH
jgi:hypothetical protein